MARAKLGDMLSVVNNAQAAPSPAEEPEPEQAAAPLAAVPDQAPQVTAAPEGKDADTASDSEPKRPTRAPRKSTRAGKPASRGTKRPVEPEDETLPRYLALERKEVRMRDDQLESLTSMSRRLNKQRRSRGERITENTLIRVAIDLLLEKDGELAGYTEEELRGSVGL